MKNKAHLYSLLYIVFATVLFAALSLLFCSHTFAYMEHWRTFYYDTNYIAEQMMHAGGLCRLLADYLCQFFVIPLAGVLINAVLLALICFEMSTYLARIAWSNRLNILALLPSIALLIAQTANNYQYEETVGIFLMLICLNIRQKIQGKYVRRIYSLLATFLLYWFAGPISMLFALTILVSRFSPFAFFPFVITFLLAGISLHLGTQGSLEQLLTPCAYYNNAVPTHKVIAWLPWLLWLIILLLGLTVRHLRIPLWITRNLTWIQIIVVLLFTTVGCRTFIDSRNEFFKELQDLCRNEEWEETIQECDQHAMDNLLFLNCRNLALAETGLLTKRFKEVRGAKPTYLMVEDITSAYISAMASDIFYSMGYFSLAQLTAFETNQQMNNLSPRMLQRLVKTNLIYGEYRVAAKYLDWLEKTWYYKDWAARYRSMLYNDAAIEADPELGNNRRCLPAESYLTGSVGKVEALKRVVQQNPDRQSSQQYLQAIYQLQ